MSDRTKSYTQYLARVQRLLGIDSLSDDDKEFLLEFYNKNGRYAHECYQWPESMLISDRTPSGGRVTLDGEAPYIGQVINVWDADPFTGSASEVPYVLMNGGIQFWSTNTPTTAYIYFQERFSESAGVGTETLLYPIFEYVCKASAGDWLISQDQYADGRALIADAEELLNFEIENYTQKQGQPFLRSVIKTHGTEQAR
jgi:hypothetical protein